jgi:hypothetical protein
MHHYSRFHDDELLDEPLALFQAGEGRLVGSYGEVYLVPTPLYGVTRGLLYTLNRV